MLHKTRGVVFRFTRYRETSVIVNIFTELFGLQSYIVNGVRSNKASSSKMALYQPLTFLDLVVYHREHAHLNRIREVKCLYPYRTITSEVKKTTLAIFLNEILNKTVREESHAEELFEFLYHSFRTLDNQESGYENFHLIFMLKLSRYLGFGAQRISEIMGPHMLSEEEERSLEQLLGADYETPCDIGQAQRRTLLDLLLKFYVSHIDSLGEIRSVQVLKEVLS